MNDEIDTVYDDDRDGISEQLGDIDVLVSCAHEDQYEMKVEMYFRLPVLSSCIERSEFIQKHAKAMFRAMSDEIHVYESLEDHINGWSIPPNSH